ncbi:MAG: hypothetical protein ACYT04_59580 [Nostoc sp.]
MPYFRHTLQAIGNDMGIPISSLIIEIEGYGKEQGSWVHQIRYVQPNLERNGRGW